jgi:RND family efflux transporter MFP subunit
MTRRKLTEVVRYLRHLADPQGGVGLSDAELLERYVRHRDEAAFELLLWRHGVLVFNVCRRVLPREQDAEDAFQATFLAFVRKAHAIARGGSVSSWLYKVAYRVALEAKARAQRTAARERPGGEALAVQPSPDPMWHDLRSLLDEELNRLPERLRRPFILCYLEGKTNEEAARQLGCRPGTVFSRLARGRELLRNRLVRRGVTLSTATLMVALGRHAAEAVPVAPLVTTTLRAALLYAGGQATGNISIHVTTLAEGVLRAMFVTKLKMAALMLFVVGLLAAGGVLSHSLTAASQAEAKAEDPAPKQEAARQPDAKPISVKVVKPTPGGLARTVTSSAEVVAAQQQQLVPLISGTIKEVSVDIGDRVKKGQTLIVLDAPLVAKEWEQANSAFEMAQAEEDEAKARVVTAEAEVEATEALYEVKIAERDAATVGIIEGQAALKNRQKLFEQKVTGPEPVEEAKQKIVTAEAKLKAAKAAIAAARADVKIKQGKLEHAKAALKAAGAAARTAHAVMDKARIQESFTQIKAAFDGVVTRRTANVGNFVQASDSRLLTPLLTLQRTDQVRVVVQLPQDYATLAERGDRVDLSRQGWDRFGNLIGDASEIITGQKIARFSPALNQDDRTMRVEIDVENPKNRLFPGMSIGINVYLNKTRSPKAFTVPASCLLVTAKGDPLVEGDKAYLYVVRDGKAHRTPIKAVFPVSEDRVEIVEGVKASDLIVTNPKDLKGEVVPVKVKKEP